MFVGGDLAALTWLKVDQPIHWNIWLTIQMTSRYNNIQQSLMDWLVSDQWIDEEYHVYQVSLSAGSLWMIWIKEVWYKSQTEWKLMFKTEGYTLLGKLLSCDKNFLPAEDVIDNWRKSQICAHDELK